MKMTRREAGTAAVSMALSAGVMAADQAGDAGSKGKIQHSVCKWCYPKIPLEDLCKEAKGIGLSSIELLGPNDWPVLAKHGLTCAMATAPNIDGLGGIPKAWNRVEHHDKLVNIYSQWIPQAEAAGVKNLICFSGNRDGMDDQQGLENCAKGLQRLMPLAEKHKVTIVMELLNSKVNHKDYMCDHTAWGVEMCKKVGSERMKLLYDIYHMQIMEGDVIATIRTSHPYIAHYHTGGVPGRNEIDESQELFYPAIVKAILATGYQGFIGQEFVPKSADALASLKQGVTICSA